MAHLESFRANTVDAPAVYVAISRAKDAVALYTDSHVRLTEALGLRKGGKLGLSMKSGGGGGGVSDTT